MISQIPKCSITCFFFFCNIIFSFKILHLSHSCYFKWFIEKHKDKASLNYLLNLEKKKVIIKFLIHKKTKNKNEIKNEIKIRSFINVNYVTH